MSEPVARARNATPQDAANRAAAAPAASATPTAPATQAGSAPLREVQLTRKASELLRRGQQWFYRDDLQLPDGAVLPSALVRVRDGDGRDGGLGIASAHSKLALRLCGPWPGDGVPDRETFFHQRLREAVERRAGLLGPAAGARLVHGESDGIPGLVVDRYGPVLVLQVTAAAVEDALDAIVPFLAGLVGAESVVARNDLATRRHEGLPQEVRLLHGRRIEQVEIEEHGVRHAVPVFTGHKTGFYLDQRPARLCVQQLAKGRSVLDLFGYQGAFALNALRGGAHSALLVDQSPDALQRAVDAARQNGLSGLVTRQGNAFDVVRALREGDERFDLIVLDPPAFAKSRRELGGALRGYRDLNRQCLRLLAPHGVLLTCSCSHHVTLPVFEDVVRQAAAGLPYRVALRRRLGAGDDHPAWIALPESEYLKVLLLQRLD